MAEAPRSIFNKKATEQLLTPDDLHQYVRVTNPSVWVALAACVALIVGLLMWGIFGTVTTNITTSGTVVTEIAEDGTKRPVAVCFLNAEDHQRVHKGDFASVDGVKMSVDRLEDTPISTGEAKDILQNDYLVSTLVTGDWSYIVYFEGDATGLSEGKPIPVSITIECIAPISLILRNWG